jgi:hypothetical protein
LSIATKGEVQSGDQYLEGLWVGSGEEDEMERWAKAKGGCELCIHPTLFLTAGVARPVCEGLDQYPQPLLAYTPTRTTRPYKFIEVIPHLAQPF